MRTIAICFVALGLISQPAAAAAFDEAEAAKGAEYRSMATNFLTVVKNPCPITQKPEPLARLDVLNAAYDQHKRDVAGRAEAIHLAIVEADIAYRMTLIDLECQPLDGPNAASDVATREMIAGITLPHMRKLAGLVTAP